jgi:membrane peptidoglycan carboxypeptidase
MVPPQRPVRDRVPIKPLRPPAPPSHTPATFKWFFGLLSLAIAGAVATVIINEMETSRYQAKEISRFARTLTWELADGPSTQVYYPESGPFDLRLGYAGMPVMLERLKDRGYDITRQTRFSDALMDYAAKGFFPPYHEKTRAGLWIEDCRNETLYGFRYPTRGYDVVPDIPPIIVQSLLFIENRELLSPDQPFMNPAVDWNRFIKAGAFQAAKMAGIPVPSMGGSTLATQMEKYRHSPEGRTSSVKDKLRQMASASVRAYQDGMDTLATRMALVHAYLNTVPLSAAPGYGEVNGLGDGLHVWFGADFSEVNRLLALPDTEGPHRKAQALALRQVMALMIAHRRPSHYLARGRGELNALTDSYLRLMAKNGAISMPLRDEALNQRLAFRDFRTDPAVRPMVTNKGINAARNRLNMMLGVPLYDLDRLDLHAWSTLQRDAQEAVSQYLHRLREPDVATQVGLFGDRLLSTGQADDVRYSFTLFERTPDGNRVRIQTDNTDQPFDINEGSKLELGSTAKFRTLTTYLEIIAEIHATQAALTPSERLRLATAAPDPLSRWVAGHLSGSGDTTLTGTLLASLDRRYSASPGEAFFTGGGLHTFNNFKREDNGRLPTVRESLQESINLPFVRMMRDIVRYSVGLRLGTDGGLISNDRDPRRQEYLARFADREGLVYLNRFWRKYREKQPQERLDLFLDGLRQTGPRLAAVHRYLYPSASRADFETFLRSRLTREAPSAKTVTQWYERYGPGKYSLTDQGYIARVHPLELWLLGWMQSHPEATWDEASAASSAQRQEVYRWLFKTRAKNARDSRIRTMLEVEAFSDIHQRWKRVGYPFNHMVPSLASALGSSGDRPAALAELMGIVANEGIRLPTLRIEDLHFAVGTPYETLLDRSPSSPTRVLQPEVASVLREALAEVVELGTARRLAGSYRLADGTALTVGGKTGTGDNRLVTSSAGGFKSKGRALNRTATFVFFLGDNHFGTLTAFVPGAEASKFRFTSALPVQVLKGMAPILMPYLEPASGGVCGVLSTAGKGKPEDVVQPASTAQPEQQAIETKGNT